MPPLYSTYTGERLGIPIKENKISSVIVKSFKCTADKTGYFDTGKNYLAQWNPDKNHWILLQDKLVCDFGLDDGWVLFPALCKNKYYVSTHPAVLAGFEMEE